MKHTNELSNRSEPTSAVLSMPRLHFTEIATERLQFPSGLFDPETPVGRTDAVEDAFPLIVYSPGNNQYTVLDGCKRLAKRKESGFPVCSCGIIQSPLDPIDQGLLRLQLNKGRPFHFREKLQMVAWLQKNTPEKLNDISRQINLPPAELHACNTLASAQPETIDAVANGWLHIVCVDDFCLLSETDRTIFIDTFGSLQLSVQIQREFLQWIPEIASARNESVESILSDRAIAQITGSNTLNPPQKISRLRDHIHSWRFPQYHEALKRWEKFSHAANPDPKHIRFEHSPAFEKNHLKVLVDLSDPQMAQNLFTDLSRIDKKIWDALIYPG